MRWSEGPCLGRLDGLLCAETIAVPVFFPPCPCFPARCSESDLCEGLDGFECLLRPETIVLPVEGGKALCGEEKTMRAGAARDVAHLYDSYAVWSLCGFCSAWIFGS